MRNWFVLNGVDSRDFGVYISGQGTFSAPRREYDMISIPGRNGDLVGNEKRLENSGRFYDVVQNPVKRLAFPVLSTWMNTSM